MTDIRGTVIAGHGVASGRESDSPYPAGTIALQRPFFQDLGLDLTDCFEGTLNVSVAPMELVLRDPDHTFECVDWSDGKNLPRKAEHNQCSKTGTKR